MLLSVSHNGVGPIRQHVTGLAGNAVQASIVTWPEKNRWWLFILSRSLCAMVFPGDRCALFSIQPQKPRPCRHFVIMFFFFFFQGDSLITVCKYRSGKELIYVCRILPYSLLTPCYSKNNKNIKKKLGLELHLDICKVLYGWRQSLHAFFSLEVFSDCHSNKSPRKQKHAMNQSKLEVKHVADAKRGKTRAYVRVSHADWIKK